MAGISITQSQLKIDFYLVFVNLEREVFLEFPVVSEAMLGDDHFWLFKVEAAGEVASMVVQEDGLGGCEFWVESRERLWGWLRLKILRSFLVRSTDMLWPCKVKE